MNNKTFAGLIGSALLLVGTQAHAEITWTFSSSNNVISSTVGNTVTRTTDGVTASAQAWSNTNNGTDGSLGDNGYDLQGSVSTSEVTAINSYKLETAYLNIYSGNGFGVKNQDASTTSSGDYGDYKDGGWPEHSIDNNQRYDSVLFSFSSAVDLNSVSLGWYNNDSDISVLRYDGAGDASNVAGKTYAQLLTLGWSLVSQVATSVDTTNKTAITTLAGTTASSYWLIGAANPLLGTAMDSKMDYVKLLALAGEKYSPSCTPGTPGCGGGPSGVPEPATLLLMGAGLLGMTRLTRRRAA